jgi:hypothetical protein
LTTRTNLLYNTFNRSWEPVKEIITSGALDLQGFKAIFQEAAGGGSERLDLHGFNDLLESLSEFLVDVENIDEETDPDTEDLSFLLDDSEDEEELYTISDKDPERSKDVVSEIISKKLNGRKEMIFENESDEQILLDVFNNLANGKDKISFKNLLNWDLVLDLLAESLLTEESLQERINACGGDSKGIDIKGFDKLVDILIELYADGELSPQKTNEQTAVVPRPLMTPNPADISSSDLQNPESGIMTGDNVVDDIFDIDVEEAFAEISQGKDYVTFKDITSWYVILEMKNAKILTNTVVRQLLEDVGVTSELDGSEKIAPMEFQTFLDALCEQFSDSDASSSEDSNE